MKTVKLEKEVQDASSLYFDLIERGFELLSVSVHERCTFAHLEDEEEKDPTPYMESFVGVPLEAPSKSTTEKRREIYRKFREGKPLRMENLRARFQVSREMKAIGPSALSTPTPTQELVSVLEENQIEVLALPGPAREGLWSKLRKLW